MTMTLTSNLGLPDQASETDILNTVVDMKMNVEVILLPTLMVLAREGNEQAQKAIASFKHTHHGKQIFDNDRKVEMLNILIGR